MIYCCEEGSLLLSHIHGFEKLCGLQFVGLIEQRKIVIHIIAVGCFSAVFSFAHIQDEAITVLLLIDISPG